MRLSAGSARVTMGAPQQVPSSRRQWVFVDPFNIENAVESRPRRGRHGGAISEQLCSVCASAFSPEYHRYTNLIFKLIQAVVAREMIGQGTTISKQRIKISSIVEHEHRACHLA